MHKSSQSKAMLTVLPTNFLGIETKGVRLVYFNVKLRNKLYNITHNREGKLAQ